MSYLVQLGPTPEERTAYAVARRVARFMGRRRPTRLCPEQSLKALSRRRLGLVRFTTGRAASPPRDG